MICIIGVNLLVNMTIAISQSIVGARKALRQICFKIEQRRKAALGRAKADKDKNVMMEATARQTGISQNLDVSQMDLLLDQKSSSS